MIFEATTERNVPTERVLSYLGEKNFSRVVDVGGGMYCWAEEFVTDIVDMQIHESYSEKNFYQADFNDSHTLEKFVDSLHGEKFDFAICTHTLEDLRNPEPLLLALPQIAKEGYIAVPSKHRELCKFVEGYDPNAQASWRLRQPYRGFMHHRWVCVVHEGIFYMVPKLGILEQVTWLDWATKENMEQCGTDLSFYWKETIPYELFLHDFLGPNPVFVLEEMNKLFTKGL